MGVIQVPRIVLINPRLIYISQLLSNNVVVELLIMCKYLSSYFLKLIHTASILLPSQVVAIKQLDRNGLQGNREFLVEVLMLSLLHHPHLVNLIGYCADGDQRLLVYEYMPLGSLEDHLHGMLLQKECVSALVQLLLDN